VYGCVIVYLRYEVGVNYHDKGICMLTVRIPDEGLAVEICCDSSPMALNSETLDIIYYGHERNNYMCRSFCVYKFFFARYTVQGVCVEELLSDSKGFLTYRRPEMS
jgi:hypothetical protein